MQFLAKRRWRLLILGVALVLILASRSFLYVNFVQPITLFLWAAWRVMASVNQNVYWSLLLALGLLPLIWMIFSDKGSVTRSAYRKEPLPPGRVDQWELLLAGANGNQKERERLNEEWDRLLQSVQAQAKRSETNDISGDTRDQTGSSPEVPRQITAAAPKRGHAPQLPGILLLLPESLQRRLTRFIKTEDRWIRESLRWMESELDIPNGNQDD
jgi:hypothetical protein